MTPILNATVIIATRNRPKLLRDTVESILRGTARPAEIVIVDQSGEPAPLDIASPAGVTISHFKTHVVGASAARNAGIGIASHGCLFFSDDDMLADPQWLVSMFEALHQSGERCAVTGRVLPAPEERSDGFVPATVLSDSAAIYSGRLNRDVLAVGNMAAFRSAFEALGWFDERLGAGTPMGSAEDNDFGFRLLSAGYHIRYVPEAVLYHRAWRPSSQYWPLRWRYGMGKGGFYSKHLPAGRYMAGRLLQDITHRLIRLPVRLWRNPRRACGDLVYICGIFAGIFRWSRLSRRPEATLNAYADPL
jgi:GT2 family glycosyltransferase